MGSAAGALKSAAGRTGLDLDAYLERIYAGMLHCWRCRDWHDAGEFGRDSSRSSGRAASCRQSKNAACKETYKPKPPPSPGRRYAEPRDGDFKQARGRINHLVNVKVLPDPNDLPCADCGHVWATGERRHEYDHHLGYAPEHHEDVEAVCTTCHHARESSRRAAA